MKPAFRRGHILRGGGFVSGGMNRKLPAGPAASMQKYAVAPAQDIRAQDIRARDIQQ
jgi:hypothetical protein